MPEPAPSGADAEAPLLILGGHRSGTSLVSGLLWEAGLHLGDLLPAGPDNPRGFFESVEILAAHEGLLAAQERDWTCPPYRLDPRVCDLSPLAAVVESLSAAGRPWGVKDPRLLFLLPAWLEIVPAVRLIGVLRHPDAVAASLTARNGFAPEAARAIADAHLGRLAALQSHLGFPVLDYDGPRPALLAGTRAVAEAMGLAWDETAAEALFDPACATSKPSAPAAPITRRWPRPRPSPGPGRVYQAWEVAAAFAALPDGESEAVPLVLGPAFLQRRHALWGFGTPHGPEFSRVLDVVPEGAGRDPLLAGVDRVEADFAVWEEAGTLGGADTAAGYSHVLLTGVAETMGRDRLTALLTQLAGFTTSDAVAVLDGFLMEGTVLPPAKRWARASATTHGKAPCATCTSTSSSWRPWSPGGW